MPANIAASLDVVSGGRLEFGIGAGSRPDMQRARREYDARYAVGSLAEACTIIRRLWTEAAPFDIQDYSPWLTDAYCSPKPVQRSQPPILIGGATSTLRVVAEHADAWSMPRGSIERAIERAIERSTVLDGVCAEVGRDPAEITRSIVLTASYDRPPDTRHVIRAALDGGFSHIVLGLGDPAEAARRVAETIMAPFADTN